MRRNYLLEFRHDLRILLTGQINIHINMRKTSHGNGNHDKKE